MPAVLLPAVDVFEARVRNWGASDFVIVSPDAGGVKRAQQYARALGADIAVVTKQRLYADQATPQQVLGDIDGRTCIVVDDIASTGRTLAGAADALRLAGAKEIFGVFTHAVIAPGADDRLCAARFKHLLTSDSIPIPSKPWLEVVPIAPLLAQTVRSLLGDGEQEHLCGAGR
jgi:ribose-phosphate pyrophosphokinase